jgi:hypothetical protein
MGGGCSLLNFTVKLEASAQCAFLEYINIFILVACIITAFINEGVFDSVSQSFLYGLANQLVQGQFDLCLNCLPTLCIIKDAIREHL